MVLVVRRSLEQLSSELTYRCLFALVSLSPDTSVSYQFRRTLATPTIGSARFLRPLAIQSGEQACLSNRFTFRSPVTTNGLCSQPAGVW